MNGRTRGTGEGILVLLLCAAFSVLALPAQAQTGGKLLCKSKCAVCHAADGKGETATGKAAKAKDFASEEVQQQNDADLSAAIASGKG